MTNRAHRSYRKAFNWKARKPFYLHMAAQVGNGIPILSSLQDYKKRADRKKLVKLVKILNDIIQKMQNGNTFADSILPWIPNNEAFAISSGEMSGRLPVTMTRIVESNERMGRIKNTLLNAATTPGIYLVAIYGFLFVMGNNVVPSLAGSVNPERATGSVAALFALGDFFTSVWAFVPLILIGLLIMLVVYSFPRWTGKGRIIADQYFPYSFYRDTEGYNWLLSFLGLLDAGMADTKVLERQIKHATPWMKERLIAIKSALEDGKKLSVALDPTIDGAKSKRPSYGFPNPDMIDNIASMYSFPDFTERIFNISNDWIANLEREISSMAKLIGFIAELVMYAIIGFLIVAINSMSTMMAGGY